METVPRSPTEVLPTERAFDVDVAVDKRRGACLVLPVPVRNAGAKVQYRLSKDKAVVVLNRW